MKFDRVVSEICERTKDKHITVLCSWGEVVIFLPSTHVLTKGLSYLLSCEKKQQAVENAIRLAVAA